MNMHIEQPLDLFEICNGRILLSFDMFQIRVELCYCYSERYIKQQQCPPEKTNKQTNKQKN